jgi:type I restriction enzyme S subunit
LRDEVLPSFFIYQVNSKLNELIAKAHGAVGLQHITKGTLSTVEVAVPPLVEQEWIVKLLDEANKLRKLRAQADRRTTEFIPALFNEMFGDPITNLRKCKRKTFEDLLDGIDGGWSPNCHDRPAQAGEWGVLKLGAVTTCEYLDTETKALPDNFAPRPELEVKAGDLLFTRKNTHGLVAACALVFETRPKLMLSDLIFRFRLKPCAELNPVFLWGLLTVPSKRKQVQTLASGSAGSMPNISKGRLLTLPIEVPPLPLQDAFALRVAEIREVEVRQAASRRRLEELFHSLVHRAFSGEL